MILARPLTAADFAPFGDVLDAAGDPDRIINAGLCGRFHDRARLDFAAGGRAGVSIFNAVPRALPYALDLVERHPLGAQCFIPMTQHPYLVIVASAPTPDAVQAFIAAPGQAINFHRGTWHGVLTPLHAPGLFAVVDYIGEGDNLQEVTFDTPVMITAPQA
ncbi:ureidoglycolate lyase [Ketogulonicigenium vulgare]|uniref:Ureidoglycolate hydrolase n=1 Tax=Ketogulonicigenium vulgare (strain WSH-001) TaxID=759362 RepID=F9Y389_KETVW|nr:ureidoglycolate lyase [Ketogulonicigenium vulgare]ADO42122.1 ureidoglycolate hydrolase [Ketogulonicigenium vulgare Y25]AEM40330.1 Ureidoglycolate hydrolase [Ketogulonicigenium vulgare WSH-001]ALJ80525.1 Ureidoglycolate hydrolase [Ketogulonicigenium vulgare]ANW33350.1 Ureidoglycolate hydrolase [Ketogulonicigenium vulgare]AOZ54042.1 ureidoglycolate hydrolase [Ketogulonicigenium vulgare]